MALSYYAAFFGWAGAALGVRVGAGVAVRRGWIRAGGQPQVALMVLNAALVQRACLVMAAAGTDLTFEAFYWLPIIAAFIIGVALNACVEAVKRRGRAPVPPRVPGRMGQFGRRA